jgi:Tfp pilus assembly PilM family ATPase
MQGDEIRAVALRRRWRKGGQLLESRIQAMPKTPSGSDDTLLIPASSETALVSALRDTLQPVALGERRVAVSLPDHCGYVLTLNIENFSRSHREARGVVAWQVGNLLPGLSNLHLDYQVLRREIGGAARLLVIAIEKEILGRYENFIQQAGYIPEYISFYGLNLYRHWRYRLDPEGDAILFSMNEEGIVIQSYRDGVMEYYRARAVGGEASHQVQELHRIVTGYGREFTGSGRFGVFLHADKPVEQATQEALSECFGRKVQLLEGNADSPPALAAALGAAECMMMGG